MSSGGPNGGSAAAVAAGICPMAFSTDYCGSIRISSSFCKLMGFMPSHGTLPFLQDHYMPLTERRLLRKGFIANTFDDIESLFLPLTGKSAAISQGPYRIAFSPDLGFLLAEKEVLDHLNRVVEALRIAGHTVELIKPSLDAGILNHFQNIVAVDRALIIRGSLERKPEFGGKLTDCTRTWLEYAEKVSGISYAYAETSLGWVKDKVDETLNGYDFLLTNVSPVRPYPVGQLPSLVRNTLVDAWGFTLPFNMSGHPVAAFSGIQLIGKRDADTSLISAAKLLQAQVAKV